MKCLGGREGEWSVLRETPSLRSRAAVTFICTDLCVSDMETKFDKGVLLVLTGLPVLQGTRSAAEVEDLDVKTVRTLDCEVLSRIVTPPQGVSVILDIGVPSPATISSLCLFEGASIIVCTAYYEGPPQ